MTLHTDTELFNQIIESTANSLEINPLYIEKDYWVTYVLKKISQSEYIDKIIFKGGTSLSKAHKLIHRFSEDIDLAIITDELNGSEIKRLIKNIEKGILDESFSEVDSPLTSKGSQFRKTVHSYPQLNGGDFGHANENIILEINSFAKPTPHSKMFICSYIYDFLQNQAPDIIIEYKLEAFEINVLNTTRTLCEKISAVARASSESDENYTELKNKIRHLYDIYFLMQQEEIKYFIKSKDFKHMLKEVKVDDAKQFSKEWTKVEFYETPIFSDTKNVIKSIELYYKTNFNDLVYRDTLPTIEKIKTSIETLLVSLK